MGCCTTYIDLGCVNSCSTIVLPYEADETGAHTVIWSFDDMKRSFDINGVIGTEISIPMSYFIESGVVIFQIRKPSGDYFTATVSDVDYDCFRVKTEIVQIADTYTAPQLSNNTGTNSLTITGTGATSYTNGSLIGKTVLLVFTDNAIRIPSDYSFNSLNGTITFISAIDAGTVIQIIYK